jgi:uncharacterized protein (TIGR00245 family)
LEERLSNDFEHVLHFAWICFASGTYCYAQTAGAAVTAITKNRFGVQPSARQILARAVEARLALGAHRYTALLPVVRDALRSGFMPTINAMAAMGLVALPGMMTGQILAGADPVDAVKYQLLIMFLISGGTGLGTLAAVLAGAYLLTDDRHRLRLDRLSPEAAG